MNKAQIKAELRRSACEDASPALGVCDDAYSKTFTFRRRDQIFYTTDDIRIFFLLVAEAL